MKGAMLLLVCSCVIGGCSESRIGKGIRISILTPCSPDAGTWCISSGISDCFAARHELDSDLKVKEICSKRYGVAGALAVLSEIQTRFDTSNLPPCKYSSPGKNVPHCKEIVELGKKSACEDVRAVGAFANRTDPRWPDVVKRLKGVCSIDPAAPEPGK